MYPLYTYFLTVMVYEYINCIQRITWFRSKYSNCLNFHWDLTICTEIRIHKFRLLLLVSNLNFIHKTCTFCRISILLTFYASTNSLCYDVWTKCHSSGLDSWIAYQCSKYIFHSIHCLYQYADKNNYITNNILKCYKITKNN